jgi:hypothetical protein
MFRPFVGQGCALSGYQGRRLTVCPWWGNCAKTVCVASTTSRATGAGSAAVSAVRVDHLDSLLKERREHRSRRESQSGLEIARLQKLRSVLDQNHAYAARGLVVEHDKLRVLQ